jgi:V-type H+-transporting ATPase subunit E
LVQQGKRKVSKEFDAKEKQIEVQRKIQVSFEINQSRLNVLKMRDEVVQAILAESLDRLAEWTKDAVAYEALVLKLLTQGLVKIGEPDVTVICRKEDVALVSKVLPAALADARKRTENPLLQATLADKFNLSPARSPLNKGESCCGGVLLSGKGGKVLCNQTLDARITTAYHKLLPQVRELLFGVNPNRKYND